MATDGPTPPPIDPDIFKHGKVVFVTHSIPSNAMEAWVKKVADLSGQRVDWSFMAGRAVVRALGDMKAVEKALEALMPEHDVVQKETIKKTLFAHNLFS